MSAALKVLNTTELLKAVLAELCSRDALLSQLVCRKWKDLINTSPTLQQKLFFAVSSNTLVHYEQERWVTGDATTSAVIANPFFSSIFASTWVDLICLEPKGESWEDMLIPSPAPSVVGIETYTACVSQTVDVSGRDGVGVTMGDIARTIVRLNCQSRRKVLVLRLIDASHWTHED